MPLHALALLVFGVAFFLVIAREGVLYQRRADYYQGRCCATEEELPRFILWRKPRK